MNLQSSEAALASSINLRPVCPDDDGFLFAVYASTRADEMSMVPWSDDQKSAFVQLQFSAQLEHYGKTYPTAEHDIILVDGESIGRLYVARLEREIRIVDITLLPAKRASVIGSYLVRGLLEEAGRTGKVVRIWVESFNPSLHLFERLGFHQAEENGIYLLMEWSPG